MSAEIGARAHEVILYFYGSVISVVYSLFLWYCSLWPVLVVFLTFCVIFLVQNVVKGSVLENVDKPHRQWVRLSTEGVDFVPSSTPAVCEWACLVGLFLSALSAICVGQYVDVPRGPYSNGLLLGVATAFLCRCPLMGCLDRFLEVLHGGCSRGASLFLHIVSTECLLTGL